MEQSASGTEKAVLNLSQSTPEYKKKQNKVRLKRSRKIQVAQLSHLIIYFILLQTVKANRPPRFVIEGQSEIVLRLKESPETKMGEFMNQI